jgi:hypothetical protein
MTKKILLFLSTKTCLFDVAVDQRRLNVGTTSTQHRCNVGTTLTKHRHIANTTLMLNGHSVDTMLTQHRRYIDTMPTKHRHNANKTSTQCQQNIDTMPTQHQCNVDTNSTQFVSIVLYKCRHNIVSVTVNQRQCRYDVFCRHSVVATLFVSELPLKKLWHNKIFRAGDLIKTFKSESAQSFS